MVRYLEAHNLHDLELMANEHCKVGFNLYGEVQIMKDKFGNIIYLQTVIKPV